MGGDDVLSDVLATLDIKFNEIPCGLFTGYDDRLFEVLGSDLELTVLRLGHRVVGGSGSNDVLLAAVDPFVLCRGGETDSSANRLRCSVLNRAEVLRQVVVASLLVEPDRRMQHLDVLHQVDAECRKRKVRASVPSIERLDDRVVLEHRRTVGTERTLRARPDNAKHHISDSLTTLAAAKQVSGRHTAFGETSEVHIDRLFEQGEVSTEGVRYADSCSSVSDLVRLTKLIRGTI